MAAALPARSGPPGRPRARSGRRRRVSRALAAALASGGVATLAVAGAPAGPGGPENLSEPRRRAPAAASGTTPPADALAAVVPSAPASTPAPTTSASTPPRRPDPLAAPLARARRITDSTAGWASFTLIDRRTGRTVGDARSAELTNTESVVKVWLAADLLATAAEQGRKLGAYERQRMAAMIRASDDDAAEVFWRMLGSDASIKKMIETCRLTDSQVSPEWWSLTQISARDIARLGACLLPGRGRPLDARASAELLGLMRTVEPSNAFGIQQAQPAGDGVRVAVKNGWTGHGGSGLWNVNCLGMWGENTRWVLAVAVRYPIDRGLDYGAAVCRRVTTALFP
jgi:hypothetical protein